MPVYTMRIVYTETLTRVREVPVRANSAEEAETIARRMFQDSQRDPILTVEGDIRSVQLVVTTEE